MGSLKQYRTYAAHSSSTLIDDSEIVNFLLLYAGKFDMYVKDECCVRAVLL